MNTGKISLRTLSFGIFGMNFYARFNMGWIKFGVQITARFLDTALLTIGASS
jgi:hypothetical protein